MWINLYSRVKCYSSTPSIMLKTMNQHEVISSAPHFMISILIPIFASKIQNQQQNSKPNKWKPQDFTSKETKQTNQINEKGIQKILQNVFLHLEWVQHAEIATVMTSQVLWRVLKPKDTRCGICEYCYVYMLHTYDVLKLECDVRAVMGINPEPFAI